MHLIDLFEATHNEGLPKTPSLWRRRFSFHPQQPPLLLRALWGDAFFELPTAPRRRDMPCLPAASEPIAEVTLTQRNCFLYRGFHDLLELMLRLADDRLRLTPTRQLHGALV